jgi:hypothetical protein
MSSYTTTARAATRLLLSSVLLWVPLSSAAQYAPGRARISRVRSDLRSIAIALDAYRLDHQVFPPALEGDELPWPLLTTPVAYLSASFDDREKTTVVIQGLPAVWRNVIHHFPTVLLAVLTVSVLVFLLIRYLRLAAQGRASGLAGLAIIALLLAVSLLAVPTDTGPLWGLGTYTAPSHAFDGQYKSFTYGTDRRSFLLQGIGPDLRRDVTDLRHAPWPVSGEYSPIWDFMIINAYDPTNGARSAGDIFRLGGDASDRNPRDRPTR